jgi:hypothetical protein
VRGRWGRCVGWPPDWGGLPGGPGPLRGQRRVARGRLFVPGLESSVRSAQLIRRWGLPGESAPWSGTGDGEVLMGRRFWVGCGWFFLGGVGEGKRKLQGTDC